MSVKSGLPYVVVRKTQKPYMVGQKKSVGFQSPRENPQDLVIDGVDIKRLQGKKAVIIDDVVSTGEP
ncbi:MAG: hypothetical protein R2865_14425 [Deinococcales bacterium]